MRLLKSVASRHDGVVINLTTPVSVRDGDESRELLHRICDWRSVSVVFECPDLTERALGDENYIVQV